MSPPPSLDLKSCPIGLGIGFLFERRTVEESQLFNTSEYPPTGVYGHVNVFFSIYVKIRQMRLVIFFCFSCIPKILLIYLGSVVAISPQIAINLCRTYEKLLRKGEPCRQDPLVQKTDKHPITYYKVYIIVLVPVLILFNTTVTLTLIYNFYIRDR